MLRATILLIDRDAYRVNVYGTSNGGLTESLICYCGPYDRRGALVCKDMFEGVACNPLQGEQIV